MSYSKQSFNNGDVITSAWGNKVEKGINESFSVLEDLSMNKTNPDANGIYQTVTYTRGDYTVYMVSTLSGGSNSQYTNRQEVYYDTDGSTVLKTNNFQINYDPNGNVASEVKV